MATIGTTTATSGGFGYPPNSAVDVNVQTGDLWCAYRDADTSIKLMKSTDRGLSWTSMGSFTRANLKDLCEIRIDSRGACIHMVYFVNDGFDRLFYRRIPIVSGSPDLSTGEVQWSFGGNATYQSFLISASLVPVSNPDGSLTIILSRTAHGSTSGATFYAISIKNDGASTTYNNNGLLVGSSQRTYQTSGDDSAITVNLDVQHNGDGITSSTPHIWASWQVFGTAYCIKLTYQGAKTGWSCPSSAYTVATNRTTVRDLPSRWDGSRYVVTSPNPSDTSKMDIFERPVSNSGSSTTRQSPSHPSGTIAANMIAANHVTKDFRLFACVSSNQVYSVDYFRASNTWGSWAQVSATAPNVSEWGVRRTTYGTFQFDYYMQSGAGTPWTISNVVQAVNFAPTAPTWITGVAGTVPVNGAAFDASVSLLLDWNFNDPNLTDTQTQYALSRQIGVAAVQWWRTSDSTWQSAETYNVSGTTAVTLTTGQWLGGGGAADPAHQYKVATKDSGGLASAYSPALSVIPSTRVDPTLTAPTTGSTLNTGVIAPTWTVSEQSAYRVVVLNTATGGTFYDSGWLSDPTPATPSVLAYTVPATLTNGFAGQVQLTTKNVEGLSSTTRTATFTITFVEPVAPVVTALTADPAAGGIDVTVTQAAATGTQPATIQLDVWRRVAVATAAVNTNPTFEVNASDWTNSSYSTVARSTTFAHSGVGSLLLTPTGAAATPKVQTTTIYVVTAGSRWEWRGWLRSTTANKTMRLYLDWYDGSNAFLSSTTRDMTPVTGVWVFGQLSGTAPAGAVGVRAAVGQLATPAAGDTLYVDDLVLIQANDDTGIRIAQETTSGVLTLDWRAVTGVNYEYRGYAAAANGTAVNGPWQS